jgi:tetratricopeptide (TPR) repeat protein
VSAPRWRLGLAVLVLALPGAAGFDWLSSPDPQVERGNARFRAGDARGALAAYRAALRNGEAAGVHLDMGTALYHLAERAEGADREALYDDAERALRRAADAERAELRAAAYFNLGHLLAARGRLEGAADAYKRALRAAPGDEAARYNLELVLRALARQPGQPAPRADGQSGPPRGEPAEAGERDLPAQPERASEVPQPPSPSQAPPEGTGPSPTPDADAEDASRADAAGEPGAGDTGDQAASPRRRGDDEKKLDALERRSRNLKVDRIRRAADGGERKRVDKDW